MSKPIKTFVKVCLWLLIMFSSLVIVMNVIVAKYPSEVLSKIIDADNISVGRVNTLFLPFFADISDFRYDKKSFKLQINSLRIETVWKNIFVKKSFVDIEIIGGQLDINDSKNKSQKDKSPDGRLALLNKAIVEDFEMSYCKNDKCFYGNMSKGIIDDGNNFSVEIDKGKLKTATLVKSFKASVSGGFDKTLYIKNISINGDSWYLNVENGEVQGNQINGDISFFLSENLIHLLDKNITGSVKGGGKFNNLDFKIILVTDELKYKNHQLFARINLEKYENNIIFSGEGLKFDRTTFNSNGQYNAVSKNIGININFSDYVVYKFDNQTVSINAISVQGNTENNDYKGMMKGNFNGDYIINTDFSYQNSNLSFKNINGKGSFGEIIGNGTSYGDGFSGDFNLKLVDVEFIHKFITDSHAFEIDTSVTYQDKKINFDGSFKSLKPFEYKKVKMDNMSENFLINDKELSICFSLNSGQSSVLGSISSEGYRDFKNIASTGSYKFSGIDIKQMLESKGNFMDDKSVSGVFSFKKVVPEPEGDISFLFPDDNISGKLNIEGTKIFVQTVRAFDNIFKDLGYVDMKEQFLELSVDNARYKDKNISLKEISVDISGYFTDPKIKGLFVGEFDRLKEKRKFYVSGSTKSIDISLNDKDIKFFINIKPLQKRLEASISLDNYEITDNLTVSGNVTGFTEDFKKISLTGLMDIVYSGRVYTLTDITADISMVGGVSLLNGGLTLFTPMADYIKIGGISFENNILRGLIYTDDVILDNPFLWNLKLKGMLNFTYILKRDMPLLYGDITVIGDIKDPSSINSLRNIESSIYFDGKKLSAIFRSGHLDTKISGNIVASNYVLPETFFGNFRFENLFLSIANFNGTVNGSLNFENMNIVSEVDIAKGFYEFKPANKSSGNKKFPFTLDLKIKTLEPIEIKGFGIKSDNVVDLRLRYEKELKLTGVVQSVNTSFEVANSKFNIVQGVLKFSENNSPYLYMNARGTGSLKNIILNVDGFLPEYNIEVRDLSPDGIGIENINQPKGDSSALIGSVFNGQVFSQIVDVTNKIFGINEIGIESNIEQKGDVFFGRRFSDRLGVKYILKSDNKLSEIVGEYTVFDWLNLNIFSSGERKTSAGISFYFNF